MSNNIFRIHPAIGIARVGNSEEYYLGPETMAGMETDGDEMGGLPIQPGEESKTITSKHIRDEQGQLKRQAARFKIYQYSDEDISKYPSGAGTEITAGSMIEVDGKQEEVASIMWQVHLANKKANSWIEPEQGAAAYTPSGQTPVIRNPNFKGSIPMQPAGTPNDLCTNSQEILAQDERRKTLVIDAGPHVVQKGGTEKASFDATGTNDYIQKNTVTGNAEIAPVTYPRQFPKYVGSDIPQEDIIDTLGEMHTDDQGRLIVLGGYGKASGFYQGTEGGNVSPGQYNPNPELENAVNNDGWFDDTSDGPVTAVIVLKGGKTLEVQGSAWVVTSDPSYAPQVPNVVSLWEDMYNTWVENFDLEPSMFKAGTDTTQPDNTNYALGKGYLNSYKPDYTNQIRPILNAANLQMWATNLVSAGHGAHKKVAEQPMNSPQWKSMMDFIRNPNLDNNLNSQNGARMPLSLGDSVMDDGNRVQDFLAISRTQYFFMYQWLIAGQVSNDTKLGAGEMLDRNILGNCLGGRFSPGIEITFIIRELGLYKNWKDGSTYLPDGPFRFNMQEMDYSNLSEIPLGVAYTPSKTTPVEPGDICKFMSIPWHTDYNSCATHETGNTQSNMTYWSWPAQRPVAIYNFDDLAAADNTSELPLQRYSVRGDGTNAYWQDNDGNPIVAPFDTAEASARVGRFQEYIDFVKNWHNVGIVMQGTAIDLTDHANVNENDIKDYFLEVESKFLCDESNKVVPGPIPANHAVAPAPEAPTCPHAQAAMKKK